jgi:hypothetical protein
MMMVKPGRPFIEGTPPPPALIEAIGKHSEEAMRAGTLVGFGGLMPSAHGARVRVSGGKVTATDGPFAETKELIGGYAIIEAASKEEAIEHGKRFMQLHADVLGPEYEGELEIRQMMDGPNCGAHK